MLNHRITGRALLVASLVVAIAWPVLARYQLDLGPSLFLKPNITTSSSPRAAASDLAFDRYLDQVIAGQSPSGTLPNLAPPTLRGTFLAVRALQQLGIPADINSTGIQAFIVSCYDEPSQLFVDSARNAFENNARVSGYSTIEATYYALASLDLLSLLQPSAWQSTADALLDLQDGSGGFACRPGICTIHDAYFAYKALQLLGNAGMANVNALATFLDARQLSDPARWWEYGAFTNLPDTISEDTDFTEPNVITSYYAVATLAACGRIGVLNEQGLVQYMGLLKNASSNLFSYASGNERAEHVGTAYLLAIDQYLAGDSSINYTSAGTALLARLEGGYLNEGRKAPANHTLSAACEMVGGLSAGGRLTELSAATKEQLRDFISRHVVTACSMTGYALTRLASLHELANLLPAITGAGKMDFLSVNALYSFIKSYYSPVVTYFAADGVALLQRDLPCCYNPTAIDGSRAKGIAVTLPALQVLQAIGRLNDFLGETHDLNNILGNITASQFLNGSAPTVSGAFCAQASFADECEGNEGMRSQISPQWTLEALETIAILDPTTPTAHFDAAAAWQYLSQWYVEDATSAYFTTPAWISVSPVEWTCRVADALCQGGMASYLAPAKVNSWAASHINGSSAREVAWHIRFVSSATGITRVPYAISTLNTLKDNLISPGDSWYHAQGGTWPDMDTIGILAQFRADRQIYLLNPTTPNPMILGGDNAISVVVSNLFAVDQPSSATVEFSAFNKSIVLTRGTSGHYSGSYQCSFDYSRLGSGGINFTATRGGWQTLTVLGSVTFAGTLVASVTCGDASVANGTTLAVRGSTISVETTMKVKLGGSESPAESLEVSVDVYKGGTRVTNMTLTSNTPGVYAGLCAMDSAGSYVVEVIVQGTLLSQFTVNLDVSSADLPNLMNLAALPAGIIVGTISCGLVVVSAGVVSKKRASTKDRAKPSS